MSADHAALDVEPLERLTPRALELLGVPDLGEETALAAVEQARQAHEEGEMEADDVLTAGFVGAVATRFRAFGSVGLMLAAPGVGSAASGGTVEVVSHSHAVVA